MRLIVELIDALIEIKMIENKYLLTRDVCFSMIFEEIEKERTIKWKKIKK